MTPVAIYTVKATRNGTTTVLQFVDPDLAAKAARELRRRGYDASADMWGTRIECAIASAIQAAHQATSRPGDPIEAPAA